MPQMTVAEYVARTLAKEQVPFVAGIPGTGLMELLDTLDREKSVRLIQTRHEQVAALMAVGYGKATGRPAVCVGTRSPGATNLVMGITAAYIESIPVIVLTGHVPSRFAEKGAFEEADLVNIFKPVTKWSAQLNRPDRIPDFLHEALRAATSGRPGPVHLAIPYDMAPEVIEAEVADPSSYRPSFRPAPDPAALRQIADILLEAQRPVLIAGGGVLLSGASEAVMRVAELLQMPIIATYQKKPVREDHPLALGNMGYGGSGAASYALHRADVVLAVGTRLWDRTTDAFAVKFDKSVRLIHIDIDPAVIGRNYPVACGVVSDARLALEALADLLQGRAEPKAAWAEDCQRARRLWQQELESLDFNQRPIGPWRVVRELRKALGPEDSLVTDSGSYIHYASRYFTALSPNVYFNPNSGSMGFGLPAAMGVQLARPHTRVALLAGDGGFMMTAQDLETAVREKLPILCVVLNNSAFGSIRTRQSAGYGNRFVMSKLTNPDFVALAKSFGMWAARVEDPDDLQDAFREALADGRPALVEVVSDDTRVESPLVQNWWEMGKRFAPAANSE